MADNPLQRIKDSAPVQKATEFVKDPLGTIKKEITSVVPQLGQAGQTPEQKEDPKRFLSRDSYRFGGSSIIPHPRMLGEPGEERLASISLTADVNTNLTEGIQKSIAERRSYGSNVDIIHAYSRFFLQGVAEAQQEKYQVVETFTAFYAFFYGKRPPVYRFNGLLLNDPNHRWTNDMMFFYENYLRGTRATDLNAQVVMYYDDRLVSGFLLGLSMQQAADMDKGVPFSMDLLVTSHNMVKFSADIDELIKTKTKELKEQREKIRQSIAAMSEDVPSLKRIAMAMAMKGKKPMVSAKNVGTPEKVNPAESVTNANRAKFTKDYGPTGLTRIS